MRLDFRPVLSRTDMRRLDEATIAAGTPSIDLMERAGQRVAAFLEGSREELLDGHAQARMLVVAGSGNNGGDGLVVARLLAQEGWEVCVALGPRRPRAGSDAAVNLERWRAAGGTVIHRGEALNGLRASALPWPLVLDALYGTGLDRPVTGDDADLIGAINESGATTVAVDIPSGLCADTGVPFGTAVVADATVTLGAAKPGLFLGVGPIHSGHVSIADIGLLEPGDAGIEPIGQVIDETTCALWLPRRHALTHKGELGHVLVVGGRRGKVGAVLLAARGALRGGAGLVTMAVPDSLTAAADTTVLEAMTLGLPETEDGELDARAWEALQRELQRFTCVVAGPGIGTGPGALRVINELLRSARMPLLIDADGLNVLAGARDRLPGLLAERTRAGAAPIVMTPHPGEMARLVGTSAADVQNDRLGTVQRFCTHHRATLVLKGAATLIGDGARLGFNGSGNPGMASAGMGDVLSGVAGAMLAQVSDPYMAASLAVYLHGLAGDILASRLGAPGFLAGEIADTIPHAIASLDRPG